MGLGSGHLAQLARYYSGEDETFATVLLSGLVALYGLQALDWDSTTIELELRRDLQVEIPRVVFDQLMALLAAITTDTVYHDVEAFDQLVSCLNRASVNHAQEPPEATEVAWAVTELQLNDPEPVGLPEQPFSKQVAAYVRVALDEDGVQVPPQCLAFAGRMRHQEWTDDPDLHAQAGAAQQSQADELDLEMKRRIRGVLDHLERIGIRPSSEGLEDPVHGELDAREPLLGLNGREVGAEAG